jgi:AraC-like DNA-binding protein
MDERTRQRDAANREELVERIADAIREDGIVEPIPGLRLTRASVPTDRVHAVSQPSFCVIARGAKEIYVGDVFYRYDADNYLLNTIGLPVSGRVVQATRHEPYLALRLELDPTIVGSVMVESGLPAPQNLSDAKAVVVSPLDSGLLDATLRLMKLLDSPTEARVLAPLVKREIIFRLLMGEQGVRLRHLPMLGGHSHRITEAVEKLRNNFDQPLRIDHLAKDLGMSSSGFHHHFKVVTDMSPLQYQKLLRLQEARRLMLGNSLDAASAGYRVGYEDPSHFSRDYKKHFGTSPMRDIEKLRQMVAAD